MSKPYPAHREADVVLKDGSTVHVRPARANDQARLLAFYQGLSEESLNLRFFTPAVDLPAFVAEQSQVDYVRLYGLVATVGPEGRIVGHGSYEMTEPGRAEVGFAVADEYQGRGLGTILLGQLAEVAEANGVQTFVAQVLPANHRMLTVLRASGFPLEIQTAPEQIQIVFPTSLTPAAIERFERREQIAAVSALTAILRPRSVAVIGASRQRSSVGGQVFYNLLSYGFNGPVYPVNPAAPFVQSVPAYPSVEAVPGPVDLAVIAVPAARVIEVARQCGRKGVRAIVVLSAGFAEVGEEGRALQDELVAVCRATGMRLVGPNCIGVINTDPDVRLDATFGPQVPPAGRVGFVSQSGALGLAAIDYAGSIGLGISSFVSTGNKGDISGNDLLNYWESDPNTHVILLYLESFGNPRKFTRIARRVGRQKPIVAVKSGRTTAGARATSSHTGALLAISDVTVDALFHQAGVIRTDTLEGLFDVAALLANQPLPRGRGVGIVTNVGGPAILCADACEAEGLHVPVLSEKSKRRLREFLPAEASLTNPVDMIASASAEQYRQAIEVVAEDPNVDAIISLFIPPLATQAEDVANAMIAAARTMGGRLPLLSVFMASRGLPEALKRSDVRIPSYAFPESAALALAHAVRYAEWQQRPAVAPPALEDIQRDRAVAIVAEALGRGAGWLTPTEIADLLACYGLPLVAQRQGATPEEVERAAADLQSPVAVKAVAPGVLHKTEAGAVRLGLTSPADAASAARDMQQRLTAAGHPPSGFIVQAMVPTGVEMIVGVVNDRQFGPVVACGAGGVLVELIRDVTVRLAPLTEQDAREMIAGLKTAPLLTGFRGGPRYDTHALEQLLVRVSAMAEDLPEIAELDFNPVFVLQTGALIVDARIRIEPAPPPRPLGARR